MSSTQNKTLPTSTDVAHFLAQIENEQRKDSETLISILQKIVGEPPVMWGSSIVGFGQLHYTYASGREGEYFRLGFSPRKGKLSLYITDDVEKYPELMQRLGKYKTGKACIYITTLADININVLEQLLTAAFHDSSHLFHTK